ncbi:MAG TPA: hypothetical protein VK922_11280 [Gemmatimonadaceae bacterium]|nr:hypothetical protein [Gemmatimonadaceae bacterium]
MTDPLVGPPLPDAPPEPEPVTFPLGWLLANASGPIQYRAILEVAKLDLPGGSADCLRFLSPTALALAVSQSVGGSWGERMLTTPNGASAGLRGVGTVHAVRRLLEYGWDIDTPPLQQARRLLFRLLALDEDAAFAFELAPKRGADPDAIPRARSILREASSAVLAQAGYNKDPRVRGAATRVAGRVHEFLKTPLAESPLIRSGNQHVLSPEAHPPSFWFLLMLAYMPLFRTENFELMDRLGTYLAAPAPRTPPTIAVDRDVIPMPHLILGDPLPSLQAAAADLPWALTWLELVARLGILQRNETWSGIFERLLAQRDNDGVWRSRKNSAIPISDNPFAWATYPLEEELSDERRWTDVTFRLGLIARIAGRPIELT